jgi:hypothetical protein
LRGLLRGLLHGLLRGLLRPASHAVADAMAHVPNAMPCVHGFVFSQPRFFYPQLALWQPSVLNQRCELAFVLFAAL